jgi:CHAT domain-containing protein/tetratricopeptide (TPR) repeat protein
MNPGILAFLALALIPQAAAAATPAGDCTQNATQSAAPTRGYAEQMFRAVLNAGVQPFAVVDYEAELRSFQRVLACEVARHDWAAAAGMYESIGVIDAELGRYVDALHAEEEAGALYRRVGDVNGQAYNALDTGDAQRGLGLYADALRSYERARALYGQTGDLAGVAMALNDAGIVQDLQGEHAAALQSVQQSDAVRGHPSPKSLASAGVILGELGRSDDALRALQEALTVERRARNALGQADALEAIAVVEERLGRYADAARDARAAAELEERLGIPRWRGLSTSAGAEAKLDRISDALRDYDAAIGDIERLRAGIAGSSMPEARSAFFATTLQVYDRYIEYLIDLDRRYPGKGYDRKAFDVFERRQGRALLEEIGKSAARRFSGVSPSLVAGLAQNDTAVTNVERTLARALSSSNVGPQVAALQERLRALQARQTALETEIKKRYPRFYHLLHPDPLDVGTLQRSVLYPNEVVLAYDVLADRTLLWVLGRSHFRTVSLPGREAMQRLAEGVRSHVLSLQAKVDRGMLSAGDIAEDAKDDVPALAAASFELYRTLVPEAVRPLVAHANGLVVVPSGPLYDVAWETLVTSVADPSSPHYLVEDTPISYVPSVSLLGLVRGGESSQKSAPRSLLAFADPTYGKPAPAQSPSVNASPELAAARAPVSPMRAARTGSVFPPLPGTLTEAQKARAALDPARSALYTGDDASRARVLALNGSGDLGTYRYVLFAAHAALPEQIAALTQPAIVLAHPEKGDAFLTMGDIFGLSLDANFVALSACDTGIAPHDSGEGISGLTRAFLYAGTPAISVTLWEVSDLAAPLLTPAFFGAMHAEGMAPAAALREAKVKLLHRKGFEHPFYWAPSVIFGDGDFKR